jgi:recombination DNA repair RAD52 pathway protein
MAHSIKTWDTDMSKNYKSKATAFAKAKKEGITDALKSALQTFGRGLGSFVYD